MILKARYILPVEGPVVEEGAVVIEGERISAVGRARDVSGESVTDYGDAVICPGFVNAHTHLELSMLIGLVPTGPDFIDWLRRLTVIRPAALATREQACEAMRAGVARTLESGVTMVGDITGAPQWTREVLSASPLSGVSFGEVIAIGPRRHLLAERLEAAMAPDFETERLRIGISPHAPYSVEPDAMRACAERAQTTGARLCIHLAESADEEPFTRKGSGPFVEYLQGLDAWDASVPVSGCGPVELAERTGLLGPRTVIAHANYVTDADISRIAASGASVAYCPRTHHAFEHPPHRFQDMLAAGINVCVGTDSLASNPSLSTLDELRSLGKHYPDLPADEILTMGTLRGARALGFEGVAGSITPGKKADLVVIPLTAGDPTVKWSSILESTQPPAAVYVSGAVCCHNNNRLLDR